MHREHLLLVLNPAVCGERVGYNVVLVCAPEIGKSHGPEADSSHSQSELAVAPFDFTKGTSGVMSGRITWRLPVVSMVTALTQLHPLGTGQDYCLLQKFCFLTFDFENEDTKYIFSDFCYQTCLL